MGDRSDFISRAAVVGLVVLIVIVGLRLARPHSTFAADGADVDWDAAVRTSRERNLPAVVLYTADWCPACQALHAGALADAAVWRELAGHHTFVTVDVTRPTDAARRHMAAAGVSGIPTLIRYDRDGHELARTHGLSADQLVAWLGG